MRYRVTLATLLAAGGLFVVAAPAQADDVDIIHLTCNNGAQHETASDVYMDRTLDSVTKIVWNTSPSFKPQRISWAGHFGSSAWTVFAEQGSTTGNKDGVDSSGTLTGPFGHPGDAPTAVRMSVWDPDLGDCQSAAL